MNKEEAMRKINNWCSECPKAHDFTCSGKDMRECDGKKAEYLKAAAAEIAKGKEKPATESPCGTCTVYLGGNAGGKSCAGCTEKTDI